MFHQKKLKLRRIKNIFMNKKMLTILDRYMAKQMEKRFIKEIQNELKVVSLVFVISKRKLGK
jgi:hypothetical protein